MTDNDTPQNPTTDRITVTRKGTSINGNPYEISIGIKAISVDGVELADEAIRALIEPIVDNIARAIETGSAQ
jgi:hypothetical protein